MSLKKYLLLYQRLEKLISRECTGSPKELAQKLQISERQLFNYLKDLKELGYAIEFNFIRNSYIFTHKLESV